MFICDCTDQTLHVEYTQPDVQGTILLYSSTVPLNVQIPAGLYGYFLYKWKAIGGQSWSSVLCQVTMLAEMGPPDPQTLPGAHCCHTAVLGQITGHNTPIHLRHPSRSSPL